jgi:hypothetical protein
MFTDFDGVSEPAGDTINLSQTGFGKGAYVFQA